MTMAAPNCCRWRRGSGTATVRAHARRRPLSRSQAGKTKTGKRCALSDPEHLASLALACYEIRDTSRTFIVANSASPYADASPASAPCGCGADHAKRSRSTQCRSFGSKYGSAHLSVVERNQPADWAACCLDAGSLVIGPFMVALRSRKWK